MKDLKKRLRAPHNLKEAVKQGERLAPAYKADTRTTHLRRFSTAIVAYACVAAVVLGGAILLPSLLLEQSPYSSQPPAASSVPDTTDYVLPETPYLYDSAEKSLGDLLRDMDCITYGLDFGSIRAEGITMWHDDTNIDGGGLSTWFNNSTLHGTIAAGEEICGGGVIEQVPARVYFEFRWRKTMRVEAYVISVGEGDHDSANKEPIEWRLLATNDPTLPVEKWTVLDYVFEGNVQPYDAVNSNDYSGASKSSGYAIDREVQGTYQYYCWEIIRSNNNAIDITEFALYGTLE